MALMFPTVMLVMNVSSVAVMWFGGHRIDSGDMQIGALTAFLSYLMQILMSVMMATFMFMMVPRAEVCAERIRRCSTPSSERACAGGTAGAHPAYRRLELREAAFRYPGAQEPVLRGVGLVARPGETTAIVGVDGQRQVDAARSGPAAVGRHRRDGAGRRRGRPRPGPGGPVGPHRAGAAEAVPVLRHGRDQPALRQGRRHRRGAVARAGDRPGAGLRRGDAGGAGRRRSPRAAPTSPAGSGSAWPSRGAVVKAPEIYLFDDSFSALDYATDAALRRRCRPETADAARWSSWPSGSAPSVDADRIVVLDEGAVVGTGTHAELMAACETYRRDRAVPADRGGGRMSASGSTAVRPPGARPVGAMMGRPAGEGR